MSAVDDYAEFDRHQRGEQIVHEVTGHRSHPEQLCSEHAHQVLSQHHEKNILGLSTGLIGPQDASDEPVAGKPHLGRCEACTRQLGVGNRQLKPGGADDHPAGPASPYTTKAPSGFFRPRQHEIAPFQPPLPHSLNAQQPPEGLTFEHTEEQTGGSKWPAMHRIIPVHPEHGRVGVLSYFTSPRNAKIRIDNLSVQGPHQRQGIGTALMDEMQRRHPDASIDHGDRTDAGKAWWSDYSKGKAVRRGRTATQHLREQPDTADPGWHERSGQRYRLVDHGTGRVSAGIKHPGEDSYGQVGYLSHFDDGEIKYTWVHPAHRRKGVATAMLAYARERHPDLDIRHSTNQTEDAKAWSAHSAARFTPTKRVFTHTDGLDHRLFDEHGKLRPDVRGYIMRTMTSHFAGHYPEWSQWVRIYFAGSEASEWTSSTLEGNNDFDILLGIDYDRYREVTGSTEPDQQITDRLNAELHADPATWGSGVMIDVDDVPTGPWDRTTYINANSWDIRKIKPYAAYDVGANRWVVKPPHLPHWSVEDLPKPVVRTLRAADDYARAVLKLPEPTRTQQGAALFEAWHTDRSRAFSERGEGWFDIANLREKWLDQHGLWAELVNCAHRAKEGLDLAPADWSNTPPGYTASLPKTQKCEYCEQSATKRVIHSEGMAYIPACPDHLDKAKADAAKSVPYGGSDPSNINAIRPIAVTMPYIRNNSGMRQYAPNGYGQEHEPWGRYMSPHGGHVPEGWEQGEVDFTNPLHVEHNGGEWKQQLSEQHGGATGKALSQALLAKGHDAVITHDRHSIGEMVDLRPKDQRTHQVIGGAAGPDYDNLHFEHEGDGPANDWWDGKITAHHPEHGQVGSLTYMHAPASKGMRPRGISVDMLKVDPEHRRRGVASQLMDELEQRHPGIPIDHGTRTHQGEMWGRHYYPKLGPSQTRGEPNEWAPETDKYEGPWTQNGQRYDPIKQRRASSVTRAMDALDQVGRKEHPNVDHYQSGGLGHLSNDETKSVVGFMPTQFMKRYREHAGDWNGAYSEEKVNSIRQDIRNGIGIHTPLTVHYDDKAKWGFIGEGNHRLRSADEEGTKTVPVRVVRNNSGSVADRKAKGIGAPMDLQGKFDQERSGGRVEHYVPSDIHPYHFLREASAGPQLHEVGTWWITPQLMVGRTPKGINHARRVASPEEAMAAIADGFTAVLPQGSWVAVRRILQLMGLNQLDIQQRLDLAQSGRIG
jgi:GNAT superfamily N-acetyltransferase